MTIVHARLWPAVPRHDQEREGQRLRQHLEVPENLLRNRDLRVDEALDRRPARDR